MILNSVSQLKNYIIFDFLGIINIAQNSILILMMCNNQDLNVIFTAILSKSLRLNSILAVL